MGKWVHRLSSVNAVEMTAICAHCGPTRIYRTSKRNILRCRTAKSLRRGNPGRGYQWGICQICFGTGKLVWDHDHDTGEFRGWICNRCNLALGMIHDQTNILLSMIEYLKRPLRI